MPRTAAVAAKKTAPKSAPPPLAAATNGAAAEWVKPETLKPWPKNPRKNDGEPVAKVAESIRRFGFATPIVARKATREIIAGHTRWKAAQKLKLDQVPVRFLDISEDEAHLLALADNKLGEIAAWDTKLLHDVLADFEVDDAMFAGWDDRAIAKLMEVDAGAGESKSRVNNNNCPHCGRYMSTKLMAAHAKKNASGKS